MNSSISNTNVLGNDGGDKCDRRPLSAYMLGFLPLTTPMWEQCMPNHANGWVGVYYNIRRLVEQLRIAMRVLQHEVDPNNAKEFRVLFNRLLRQNKILSDQSKECEFIDAPHFKKSLQIQVDLGNELSLSGTHVLKRDCRFACWFGLGRALGTCWVQPNRTEEFEDVPSLLQLIEAAKLLPEPYRHAFPEFERLAHFKVRRKNVQSEQMWNDLFDGPFNRYRRLLSADEAWAGNAKKRKRSLSTSQDYVYCFRYRLFDVLWAFHLRISSFLHNLPSAGPAQVKPEWNCDSGVLTFDGQVCREYISHATNVSKALNEFQDRDWPRYIYCPRAIRRDLIQEVRKSLNKGLSHIRFHVEGQGKTISWKME